MYKSLLLIVLTIFQSVWAREPVPNTLNKEPEYFVKLYGEPITSKIVDEKEFRLFTETPCVMNIKGPFGLQTYGKGNLQIEVTYILPEAQAIYVCYTLPNTWTKNQLDAAVNAYGKEWLAIKYSGYNFAKLYQSSNKIIVSQENNSVTFYHIGMISGCRAVQNAIKKASESVPQF